MPQSPSPEILAPKNDKTVILEGKWKVFDPEKPDECGRECRRVLNGVENSIPKPIRFIARFPRRSKRASSNDSRDIIDVDSIASKGIDVVTLHHLNAYIIEPKPESTPSELEAIRKYLKDNGVVVENDEIAYLTSYGAAEVAPTEAASVSVPVQDGNMPNTEDGKTGDRNVDGDSNGKRRRRKNGVGLGLNGRNNEGGRRGNGRKRNRGQNQDGGADGETPNRRNKKRGRGGKRRNKKPGKNVNGDANGNKGGDRVNKKNMLQYAKEQWYIPMLEIDKAMERLQTLKTSPMTVCIIDTGVDYNNKALLHAFGPSGENKDGEEEEHSGDRRYGINAIDETYDPMDLHGHGTGIAGLIAGKMIGSYGITGINPNVRLVACKAFGMDLKGRLSDVLKCMNYCMDRKADIQNHSWTLPAYNSTLLSAFKILEQKNVLMVVSAGNMVPGGPREPDIKIEHVLPATFASFFSNILTVAGLEKVDEVVMEERLERCRSRRTKPDTCDVSKLDPYQLYSKTQYGKHICQVIAPAKDIYTLGLQNTMVMVEGVSFATGIMSGVTSILLSAVVLDMSIGAIVVPNFIEKNVIKMKQTKDKVRWGGYVSAHKCLDNVYHHLQDLREIVLQRRSTPLIQEKKVILHGEMKKI
ncbi:subtilisin-like protease [Babesia ovis]|uniref:subtilisin n=1 Tax=Babesia ovis TaxID=5869 RepID=A0A9W5TBF7_BABOV|nr:subtilisin-like protease [Babesia ovis]